jgi:hypothetical protein
MMVTSNVLFIDANQYIKLYGMASSGTAPGEKILDWIEEQSVHIFVTRQIVDEVFRNKLKTAQTYFLDKVSLKNIVLPDHLLGISDEKLKRLQRDSKSLSRELDALADDVLPKISRSEDDISQKLDGLFASAVSPNQDQMKRARDRKERGNPPGKPRDPLGDQITWEQLLTHCKGKEHLWIITADPDYGVKHRNGMLLNSLLRNDLANTCGTKLESHYYDNLSIDLTEFRAHVGVAPSKLPTPAEVAEIKKEEETFLPPLPDRLYTPDDATALLDVYRRKQFWALVEPADARDNQAVS